MVAKPPRVETEGCPEVVVQFSLAEEFVNFEPRVVASPPTVKVAVKKVVNSIVVVGEEEEDLRFRHVQAELIRARELPVH